MKKAEAQQAVIEYWMEKADEALQSARSEQHAGRLMFAINRAYYACFYAASAVLLREGEEFSKHTGVRAAVHRSLVKTGKIDTSLGRFYDLVFQSRQRGDYQELVEFSSEEAEELVSQAQGFVEKMRGLLKSIQHKP
jgi:uncharacterized protein (UPF0332 family)